MKAERLRLLPKHDKKEHGNFGERFYNQYNPRAYSPATVIAAQKRVIKLAINTIGRLSRRQLLTLRMCGDGGLITLNELAGHLVAAWHLKVRRKNQKRRAR